MSKPTHQWQTRDATAVRVARPTHEAFASDPRAERFELRFADGRVGDVSFGLDIQHADRVAASDPDLTYAAMAWLAARGQREIQLCVMEKDQPLSTLCALAFSPHDLGAFGAGDARRLVTLCPSNVELVDALGCFSRVVACDVSSDYPAGVEALERLGHDLAPELDRIAAIAPDLVVSSLTVPGMERVSARCVRPSPPKRHACTSSGGRARCSRPAETVTPTS